VFQALAVIQGTLPGTGVAGDIGIFAAAIVSVSAVLLLIPRLIKAFKDARERRHDKTIEQIAVVSQGAATTAVQTLSDKLFSPNGGRSLYDIARRVEELHSAVEDVHSQGSAMKERVDRLEHQVDDVLIPNQTAIAHKLGATNRHDDF
jgi:hypothetical protein